MQKMYPYYTTFAAVLSIAYIDKLLFKKSSISYSRLGGAAFVGLAIGGFFRYSSKRN